MNLNSLFLKYYYLQSIIKNIFMMLKNNKLIHKKKKKKYIKKIKILFYKNFKKNNLKILKIFLNKFNKENNELNNNEKYEELNNNKFKKEDNGKELNNNKFKKEDNGKDLNNNKFKKEDNGKDLNNINNEKDLFMKIGKVRFFVFAGREKNLEILHKYVNLAIMKDIIDEYHIFDFSRNIDDHNFLKNEFIRFNEKYENRIFLHNFNENEEKLKTNIIEKTNWNPFYKYVYNNSNDNDIIIKCDDDILFIDIYSLKNAIEDRFKDRDSFLHHSNCMNNGVCAYFQKDCFIKIKDILNIYPLGGILGILFEKPEIAHAIHCNFIENLLNDINNLNKYIIKDEFINSRISINFIILNGSDAKYLNEVGIHDEYEISSFIPEKLLRANKIKGDFITSHLSYNSQESFILTKSKIVENYNKIADIYINFNKPKIINLYNEFKINNLLFHKENDLFIVKNWLNNNLFYIKNEKLDKYIYVDFEKDELELSNINKTLFSINKINNKINTYEIKLGVFYLTTYNIKGKLRNEKLLYKCIRDDSLREIIIDEIDINNPCFIKFKKNDLYLIANKENLLETTKDKNNNIFFSKWIFENKFNSNEHENCNKYIKVKRFIKNNKFYYQNIENNEIFTNYYLGWGYENILEKS